MTTSDNLLQDIFPQIAAIGQIIGQFYTSIFSELGPALGIDRAEIQAYMLTKVFMDSIFTIQREKIPTADSVFAQVLAQFQPKVGS